MFPDTTTRVKIDLAGQWKYTLDGNEWSNVFVPSAYDFKGKVTFTRTFEIKSEMLDRYTFLLVCYGINHQSEIMINGNFVGRHQGGYTSFVVAIPPNTLQMGSENSIKVLVDNELTPTTTLPLRQQSGGWRTYGGICRDIYILAVPKLFIEDVTVKTDFSLEGRFAKVSVVGDFMDRGTSIKQENGKPIGFQVTVFDKLTGDPVAHSGVATISPQQNKLISTAVDVAIPSPKFWFPSPDTSSLYVFKCQLVQTVNKEVTVLDEFSVDVGLRDIQWKDGRLYVNSKPITLKGLLWQEDHAMYASAMSYEAMEKDVASLKILGANLVRFPYPPHPYMLNLCNRYGLMVMEEIPLVNVPAEILSRDYYQELATTAIKEMIGRDKNNACIIAWGIGDEIETGASNACDVINSLRNSVKSNDHRQVYLCTEQQNDTCFEYVDLIGLNTVHNDAKGLREELKSMKSRFGDKPIIVTRYGSEVEPGNRNGYSDPLSLESQARVVMQTNEAMKDAKIAGSVLWSFSDWRTDRPSIVTHSHNPYMRTMGIVSYDREKRPAYDVVRVVFNGEKVQALPIGNYSSSAPFVYILAGLVALLSFAFLYNGNRRFRDGVNRSMFRTYNFFADVRDQRILTYMNSISLALIISLTWATLISSVLMYYRDSVTLDNILSQMMSDHVKELFVWLVWSPAKFILVVTGCFFFGMVLMSIIVRLLSMMVRVHVYFYHAFSVTMWSLLPYIVLIPIAMIFYRLMESHLYVMPVFILVGVLSVWVLMRLLKGISIIYDVLSLKVYAMGLLILLVIGVALYGYADYTRSTTVYLKYLMRTSNSLAQ